MDSVIITALLGGITTAVAWITGRKKNSAETRKLKAEAESIEVQSIEKAVAIWRDLAGDLSNEIERYRKSCEKLNTKVDQLTNEVHMLRKENKELKGLLEATNSKI